MFLFFSSRTGCLGSILFSVLGSLVILALMKGCARSTAGVERRYPPAVAVSGGGR